MEHTCDNNNNNNNNKINLELFNKFVFQFLRENQRRKTNCISFSIFYENEKRMKVLNIQTKNLLNMKMAVNYLNFIFLY